jgi:hypothetical protein
MLILTETLICSFGVHVTVHRRHSEGKEPTSHVFPSLYGPIFINTPAQPPFTRPFNTPIPSNPTHPVSTWYTKQPPSTHTTNNPRNSLHHNTSAHYLAYPFQVWPPKSGIYSLIVLLMLGILVPETCWGNKNYVLCRIWSVLYLH